MIWAYRYWALTDSTIVLDATKSTDQYLTDLYTITREMETISEQYSSDFQEFTYTDKSQTACTFTAYGNCES
ncbi:hypothetical protein ACN38_g2613 [Penicillium nordicum]|uniref:Uncharacterized protein n=1 Tax=Penicillium nordicum TaxID=229535 RepID=A0A0M8PEB7_9EURO|nr:hypothetical protein ACN38_g2613 [Penicillium nordicum]